MGCGIGGPARNIAAFSGVNILGVNLSDYQIRRAVVLTKTAQMDHLVQYQKVFETVVRGQCLLATMCEHSGFQLVTRKELIIIANLDTKILKFIWA